MAQSAKDFSRSERHPAVRLARFVNWCVGRLYHRVRLASPCPLPKTGAAIVVCNHISGLDPILIQTVTPRLIRWMMAREYYEQRGGKWLLDLVGAIPVDRTGKDLAATRAALAALEKGYVLGIFPEGKIETSGELLPFQAGIVLLAAKSGAPIYPAYLDGTQRGKEMLAAYLRPNRATLAFGPPLVLDRSAAARPNMDAAAQKIWDSVNNLRKTQIEDRKYQ
jgi:1-acyl-sn-glycerol-3-phosphate acyltransferase